MKIELVEDYKLYGVVMEIPEYVESYILFENTKKSFSNVYNKTDSKYVVTLYTDADTYINFLTQHTSILNICNNDKEYQRFYDQKIATKNKYTVVLNSKFFIKGVVRKVPKDEKLIISEELPLDPPFHTIHTYRNECNISNDEICEIIVKFIKDIASYKTNDKINNETIKAQKHKIEQLNESMNNEQIPINKEIQDLKDTIKERQAKLKHSNNEIFVSGILCTLLQIYITVQWWYS